ncbi:hypothetical protein B0H14DRAFT_2964252, partial [Mycena olivaceomarginata]
MSKCIRPLIHWQSARLIGQGLFVFSCRWVLSSWGAQNNFCHWHRTGASFRYFAAYLDDSRHIAGRRCAVKASSWRLCQAISPLVVDAVWFLCSKTSI